MRILFLLSLLVIPTFSTPIYNPAIHRVLPGHEYQVKHVKHVDEHGRVTYIHDTKDHRPDFCAIPGEDELCRQQIEAANNAPAVFDNDTIIIEGPHDPNEFNELAPGHDAFIHDTPASPQDSDSHSSDTTLTFDNGDTITIHNEGGHPKNTHPDGPADDNSHIPNINIHPQSRHQETIKEDGPIVNVPHPRNINDGNNQQDGPAGGNTHARNINEHGQSRHAETIKQEDGPIITVPHPRNINDGSQQDGPAGDNPHPRNIKDGQSVAQQVSSSPIMKLQQAIKQVS
jgi:hypothetical protein